MEHPVTISESEELPDFEIGECEELSETIIEALLPILTGLRVEHLAAMDFEDLSNITFTDKYLEFLTYCENIELNIPLYDSGANSQEELQLRMAEANANITKLNNNMQLIKSDLEYRNTMLRKNIEAEIVTELDPNINYLYTFPDKNGIFAAANNKIYFMPDILNYEYNLALSPDMTFKKIKKEEFISHSSSDFKTHNKDNVYAATHGYSAWRKYIDYNNIIEAFNKNECFIVTYDIECGRIDSDEFPHVGNPNVKIGLICAHVYDLDYNLICDWNGATFATEREDVTVFANDSLMCIEFINFILELQESRTVLLTSFNGSSAYPKGPKTETPEYVGFDLSHILYKSGLYHHNKRLMNCKPLNNGWQVAIVPAMGYKCLHIDLMPWLIADTIFRASESLSGHKLNDFLEYARIPMKLDCDHREGTKIIFEMESSMSVDDYINYCQYDAHSLSLLMKARSFVDKIEAVCKYFECGLYSALYQTPVKMITNKVMRDYFRENYAFSYDRTNLKIDNFQYRGALTFAPPEELMSRTIIEPVLGEDFVSLYPNVMLSRSIAPDTFLSQSDELDPTYDPKDVIIFDNTDPLCRDDALKNYIYFKRIDPQESPLLRFINSCFTERIRIKNVLADEKDPIKYKYLDNMQYALKIAINSSYGAMASLSCLFYSPYAAACVTLGARYALSALRTTANDFNNGKFIIGDTDSSFILCTLDDKQIEKKTAGIEYILNDISAITRLNLMWSEYDLDAVKNYGVACEDYFIRTLFSKAKKSYLALNLTGKTAEADFLNFYKAEKNSIEYIDGKLFYTINGVKKDNIALLSRGLQLGQFRPEIKKLIKSFLIEWLINPISSNKPDDDKVLKFIREWVIELVIQAKKEIADNPIKYAHKVKLNGRSAKVEFLKKTYPKEIENLNECYIFPIKNASKLKSEKWAPINACTIQQIDFKELLAPICSNLGRFVPAFKKYTEKSKTFKGEEYDASYTYNFRCEKLFGDKVDACIKGCEYEGIQHLLNSYDSVHEVILSDIVRIFFDIDGKDVNIPEFANAVRRMVGSVGNHLQIFVASAHSENKKSYHITFNVATQLSNIKYIAATLKKDFYGIDLGVYSVGKSLRIPGCNKIDRKNKRIEERPFEFPESECTLGDFLLSNTKNLMLIDGKPHTYDKIPIDLDVSVIQESFGILPKQIHEKIVSMLKSNIKIQNNGGFYRITPIRRNICPICNVKHDNDNQYTFRQGNNWILGCYRSQEKIKIESANDSKTVKIEEQIIQTLTSILSDENGNVFDTSINKIPEPLIISDFEGLLSIKAQMGVGKTKAIGELIDSANLKRVVYISPRRTLSRNMAERLGLTSYLEISGEISLFKHPKLIIQVDSIGRLELDTKVDILILDEWSSSLNQISGSCVSSNFGKMYNIISKLQRMSFDAKRTVIMDANLTTYDISLAEQLFRRQAQLINNYIKPFSYSLDIVQLRTGRQNAHLLVRDFESQIEEGKRIAFSCTSVKLAKKTAEYFAHLNPVLLTGLDQDVYTLNGITKNIFQWKHEFMADPDAFLRTHNPQMLIYTTTMTCGVSINIDYFDVLVGYYNPTSNPVEFCQSLGRCRKIRDKKVIIYIPDKIQYVGPVIPAKLLQATSKRPFISKMDSLKIALNARENAQTQYGIYIVAQSMKEMGYKLNECRVLGSETVSIHSEWSKAFPKLPKEDFDAINQYRINNFNQEIIDILKKYEIDEYNTKMNTIFPEYYIAKSVQKIFDTCKLPIDQFLNMEDKMFNIIYNSIKIIRAHQYENPDSWTKPNAIYEFINRTLDISTSAETLKAKAEVIENINQAHEDLMEAAAVESQIFAHLHHDLRIVADKIYNLIKNWKNERADSPNVKELSELIKFNINIINKVLRTAYSKNKLAQIVNSILLFVQKGAFETILLNEYDANRNKLMAYTYVPIHLINKEDPLYQGVTDNLHLSIKELNAKNQIKIEEKKYQESVTIVCDGASRGSQEVKNASYGAVFYTNKGEFLLCICENIGDANNVVAEYRSIISGMRTALDKSIKDITIICDCLTVVKQLRGEYKVSKKADYLRPLIAEYIALEELFDSVKLIHKVRKFTQCADFMANYALDNNIIGLAEFDRTNCPIDNEKLAMWITG